jgi:hypothetical protein
MSQYLTAIKNDDFENQRKMQKRNTDKLKEPPI